MHHSSEQKTQKSQTIQSNSKTHTLIGVLGCIGGLFTQLVIGSIYQWGIVSLYFTSYFRLHDLSVSLESNSIAFPLTMLCLGLTMRLGLYLSEKVNPFLVILASEIVTAAVIFGVAFVTNVWIFNVLYCIIYGLVQGLSFMIPLVECNKYFPGKKMLINGFILMGTGIGPLVFGMFSYNYINPDKLPPFEGYYLGSPELIDIALRAPSLLKWLSLLYLIIGCLGALLMVPMCLRNKANQGKINQIQDVHKIQKQSEENFVNNNLQSTIDPTSKKTILPQQASPLPQQKIKKQAKSFKQAISSWACWAQILILILGTTGLFLINGSFKTIVKSTITDDQFLTVVGVLASISNGCSRVFWNIFFSKTGYKTVTLVNLIVSIIGFATIRFTFTNKVAYLIEVFIINACVGGFLVTTPTFAQALYGHQTGSNIYGFYWMFLSLANFIQYGFVQGLSHSIGFINIIYICLGMSILAIPFVIFTKFQGPWKNDTVILQYFVSYELNKIKDETEKQKQQKREEQVFQDELFINPEGKENQKKPQQLPNKIIE